MRFLLEVRNLFVSGETGSGNGKIIDDVSFSVKQGELVVLLGESGSGKTVLSRSLTGLFPDKSGLHVTGAVNFDGNSILSVTQEELLKLRRRKIRYIFQEPAQALNPVATIRSQLMLSTEKDRVTPEGLRSALTSVGLHNVDEVLESYPHQLSVGMAQRVMIAMAMLASPALLIADEPTSSVDAPLRYQLLDLLTSIQKSGGMSLILITHDLDVARLYGEYILLLYKGRIVEAGPKNEFFDRPLHPYAQLLLDSRPTIGKSIGSHLPNESNPAKLAKRHTGCRFYSRCHKAQDDCALTEPPLEKTSGGREVRCFYWR